MRKVGTSLPLLGRHLLRIAKNFAIVIFSKPKYLNILTSYSRTIIHIDGFFLLFFPVKRSAQKGISFYLNDDWKHT